MWVRKLTIVGNSNGIILPPAVTRALGWKRGDYINVQMVSGTAIMFTKLDITHAAARVARAEEGQKLISYD